jgi:hypothetical protein
MIIPPRRGRPLSLQNVPMVRRPPPQCILHGADDRERTALHVVFRDTYSMCMRQASLLEAFSVGVLSSWVHTIAPSSMCCRQEDLCMVFVGNSREGMYT